MEKCLNNKMYHVFTDGKDAFVDTILDAIETMEEWRKESFYDINVRIYIDTELEDGEFQEDYIYGEGSYPD